ncbi:bifunctional [glutamine synthetase] adenylyltransferase/[glutamine synthetase]-adenylyl-L-tyrosine phosphorylase [Propionibacteriaceae bacterium Y2011]
MSRHLSSTGRLARLGLTDASRAADLVRSWPYDDEQYEQVLAYVARAGDPDHTVATLSSLFDIMDGLAERLLDDPGFAERLVMVLGGSKALGRHLVSHPDQLDLLADDTERETYEVLLARLLTAVGADPDDPTPTAIGSADQLRLAYRGVLLQIAARDLSHPDPTEIVGDIAAELSDLADATVAAALALARAEVGEPARQCRLAIIALGKCGSQELNYVSDVDVLFVAEPASDEVSTDTAIRVGTRLAAATSRICSAHTRAGTIWELDAALRPEGKAGPLVRSLASMENYYSQWAKAWEFQAMLKARPMTGDLALAREFCTMIGERVWRVAEQDGFVNDARAMRRRVLEHIPAGQVGRELKLGAGGLRDVEFPAQLLQLVHGRVDERIRVAGTLPALKALTRYGYVGRDVGKQLAEAYRFIRVLEHRVQLTQLRRTHLLPTDEQELRVLNREVRAADKSTVEQRWRRTSSQVERLQQQLFYSPVLQAVSKIRTDALRLTTEAAVDRLRALGFHDPKAALQHVEALTTGVTRQAEIQRQLLPAMLGWLAEAPNPDHGLLAFRQLSESLGRTPWYLRTLRDEGTAARRLARLLASSRYVVQLLQRAPEAVQLLTVTEPQEPRTLAEWRSEMLHAAKRQDDPMKAVQAIRSVRRRGMVRIAGADVLGLIDVERLGPTLTDLTTATIDAALSVMLRDYDGPPMALIGLGRWGGAEMSYASDADAMFVLGDDGDADAVRQAGAVITRLRQALTAAGPLPVEIDTSLRPEGKGGQLIRTMSSYRAYYARWSSTWELQALVRADAKAGDAELGAELMAEIDRHRWPEGGLTDDQLVEIRRLKARMEAERLPRGADRNRHLKLGPGGLSDVEWTVQVLQLQHAHAHPELRTTTTLTALAAARELDLIEAEDAEVLREAWTLSSRIRDLSMLVRGKASDVIPSDVRELSAVAELLGYGSAGASHLESDHRRITRRALHVVNRLFWDEDATTP